MTEALTVQTPLDLIAQATMDKDVDADKLEKLLAVLDQRLSEHDKALTRKLEAAVSGIQTQVDEARERKDISDLI